MKDVVIVSAVRTAVGKAPRGTLRTTRPDDLAAFAIQGALERIPQLDKREIEDVILGCAMPEAEQGMNVARVASFRAGLPIETAAMTINRYCASGLQSIAIAADRIRGGSAEVILAGGTESMSYVPFGGNKISVNPWLVENYPGSYMSMGLTAERVASHYGITREAMDQFSYDSHRKALAAIAAGRFDDEIVPVTVTNTRSPRRRERRDRRRASSRGRRSPRRHLARGTGEAEAGLPCQGDGDGRELVADLRRSRRCGRHVGQPCRRARASSRWQGSSPLPMRAAIPRRWASALSTPFRRR